MLIYDVVSKRKLQKLDITSSVLIIVVSVKCWPGVGMLWVHCGKFGESLGLLWVQWAKCRHTWQSVVANCRHNDEESVKWFSLIPAEHHNICILFDILLMKMQKCTCKKEQLSCSSVV